MNLRLEYHHVALVIFRSENWIKPVIE